MQSHLRTTSYLLILMLALAFVSCKKSDSPSPSAFSRMGGVRHWHGSHYYDASGIHFPTPVHEAYNYADTTLAVTIVNDTTVKFMGVNYTYDQTDSVKQINYFGGAYYYFTYGVGSGLAYYYAKDSIVYCEGDTHATSDQWILRNLRYTF